ncbi:MAG: hypothetical protein Q9219_002756 [cf. Caloplaca sp. 3 TL-2023]
MFVRASRLKLNHNACQQLSPADLNLPWLCPALYSGQRSHRSSSTVRSSASSTSTRRAAPKLRRSSPSAPPESRGLASAATFEIAPSADEHVPFESQTSHQPPRHLQLPWSGLAQSSHRPQRDTLDPLIINDSLTTKPPRFRSFDAITGELHEILSTMKACLHVGRFDRAATLMQRMNDLYKPDAPALLAAHNDYIRESTWKIVSSTDQQLLDSLQRWFEVELRGRGVVPNAYTYAFMIQASLQDISISKSNRSVRRYLHLAEEAGLRDELMNALLTVLNEQDFGRVTRVPSSISSQATSADRYSQIDLPPSTSISQTSSPNIAVSPSTTPSNQYTSDLPKVRPVDPNLSGWKALRQSLSVFSNLSEASLPDNFDDTEEEKAQRLNLERQLRMEQDTYESAIGRWRSDSKQLRRIGINGALTHNSFGAMMWDWHQSLEPAIREEIRLANEAEDKANKKAADEQRCHYGPFLQYLPPEKLSAITILKCMTLLGTAHDAQRGCSLGHVVGKIGEAIERESVAEYLRKSRASQPRTLQRKTGIRELNAQSRRRQIGLPMIRADLPSSSVQALEEHRWGSAVHVRVGAILLSKLMEIANVRVSRKQGSTGPVVETSQPALLHRFLYKNGRRLGMLSLNSTLYEQLSKEPVAASLAQKYLPMLVEPKPWSGFREGGFLTSTEPCVRIPTGSEQSKHYCMVAAENGDMAQVFAGLDVLSKTPWQINGPVLEVVLEAWNSGKAIGGIAPDDPDIELPPEPPTEDKPARARYLNELKRISEEKLGFRSIRCFQSFQLEIARAYLRETFYFPHNIDFRGRAYPMSPFFNYMGADLARGLLTFGVGKPLGTNGLKWMKIHLSNVYGYDKASFEERINFVDDHIEGIFDSADKPLAGQRWWLEAEDPWQCLAACKELQNALKSPDPSRFVSKLAIHQDGTCNGLQHYAALGGDSVGAKQVNLEPGDRPSDIYSGVAELVQREVAADAQQGHSLGKTLEGKVTRKVVKQTVMTSVYGVTRMGAMAQIYKQLKELYPDLAPPGQPTGEYRSAASTYLARKIFGALANMFNGAHDIQYWLGECGNRIATAITPAQMQRIKAVKSGTWENPVEFQRTPLKRRKGPGRTDELLSFKQSVIWTTPLKMPVVQPYRQNTPDEVQTNLQSITLQSPSLADPVNKRKQLQAFPPNFIHSLDATHMVLSAMECEKQGLAFTAVHDSFWTHAADIQTMNGILRDAFITMHSEDIIGRLSAEFAVRYKDCMYLTAVLASSQVGKKIAEWRRKQSPGSSRGSRLQDRQIDELLQERRRQELLASEVAEQRKEGESMMTACSIFEQMDGEADLAVEESLEDVTLGSLSSARANKLQADEKLEVGDEDNIGRMDTALDIGAGGKDQRQEAEALFEEPPDTEAADAKTKPKAKRVQQEKVWLWRALTFPPVPKKGEFDVSRIKQSQYFFS